MNATAGRILYAGTYEHDYPRNALAIRALRRAGFSVREVHEPVWERHRDKAGTFLRPVSLLRLAGRLVVAYGRLIRRLWSALPMHDAVVIGYIGQADMLLLAPLAKLRGRPVVFNPLVTLTDTLVEDRQIVAPTGLWGRLIAAADRWALQLADAVVVDTPENAAYVAQRFRVPQARIYQVDVGADETIFHGEIEAPLDPAADRVVSDRDRTPLGSGSTAPLRLLFYGKFIPLHGIDIILQAAHQLGSQPDFRFEIIGSGQLSSAMRDLARRLDLRNVDFIPWVPLAELPARIAAADVVLGIFGDTAKAARVVPNKVFQAMAMGAAIVTRDSPAIRRLLTDRDSALLVPAGDPAALADAILRLGDPDLRVALGREACKTFCATASLEVLAQHWSCVLSSLVERSGDGIARSAER